MTKTAAGTLNRRDAVKVAGAAITAGMLPSVFGAELPAGANCMTILYPAGAGLTFNADYYRDHHLVTIMKLYGKSISRFELRTVAPAAAGAPPGAFAGAINIWIADLETFNANNAKHGPTLVADVPNFTNTQPSIQFDRIHGEMGVARSKPKVGDTCLTILYKNSDTVKWDVDYYRTGHMPLIMRLYGSKAIKRFELRKGDSGQAPGTPPAYIGTVNIYINDQAAFDAAGKEHGPTLVRDVPNFSSVNPSALLTTIYGIG